MVKLKMLLKTASLVLFLIKIDSFFKKTKKYFRFPQIKHFSSISFIFSPSFSLRDPKVSIMIPALMFTIMTAMIKLFRVSKISLPGLNFTSSSALARLVRYPPTPPLDCEVNLDKSYLP